MLYLVKERELLCLQLLFKVKVHDLQLHLFCACCFVPSLDEDLPMVPAGWFCFGVWLAPSLPGFASDPNKSLPFFPQLLSSRHWDFTSSQVWGWHWEWFRGCSCGVLAYNSYQKLGVCFQKHISSPPKICEPSQITSTIPDPACLLDVVKCTAKHAGKWSFLLDCHLHSSLLLGFLWQLFSLFVPPISSLLTLWIVAGRKGREYFSWGMNSPVSLSHSNWTPSWECYWQRATSQKHHWRDMSAIADSELPFWGV